jgi:hypothetical protein
MSLPFFIFVSKEGDYPKIMRKFRRIGSLGLCFIVMGLSLAAIYVLWASFGYIGPSFSENVLNTQQSTLRAEYGLPKQPIITDPATLQTPPSLRELNMKNNTNSTL